MKKDMTILKAIGIIMVVMGHKYNPFSWYPPYSFHMALFIFISGYFYNEKYESNKGLLVKKRFKSYVVPYFIWNFFYMVVTYLLKVKYKFILGDAPSLKSFFITPFVNGHQYSLYLAAWFVLTLFIVQVIFVFLYPCIKKFTKNEMVHLIIFILLGICATTIAGKGANAGIKLFIIKTLFGLLFFYLGVYYKRNLEHKNIFNVWILGCSFLIQMLMIINFKNIEYTLAWGNFSGHTIIPIVASINGIYLYLFVSKAISNLLPDNDILFKIGRNTVHIMNHHILIFFIINYIFIKVYNLEMGNLNDVWYAYDISKYWLVYVGAAILVPTFVAEYVKYIKTKLINWRISKNADIRQ